MMLSVVAFHDFKVVGSKPFLVEESRKICLREKKLFGQFCNQELPTDHLLGDLKCSTIGEKIEKSNQNALNGTCTS